MGDIIIFENLSFRPSTRKREAGVFNLHSGKRFWKDAFLVTFDFFTGYLWTVGQTSFSKKKKKPDTCGRELKENDVEA